MPSFYAHQNRLTIRQTPFVAPTKNNHVNPRQPSVGLPVNHQSTTKNNRVKSLSIHCHIKQDITKTTSLIILSYNLTTKRPFS